MNVGKKFDSIQFEIGSYKAIVVFEKGLRDAVPLVHEGLLKASSLLKSKNDIVVTLSSTDDKFIGDAMGGVSGYTSNDHSLSVSINPATPGWKDFLAPTIAHEFSHVVRFQKVSGKENSTILGSLAFEGLAQCFEEAVTGNLRPWSKVLDKEQAMETWIKIREILNANSRDFYNRLFIKKDDPEFRHWSGYSLGYIIVKMRIDELGRKPDWEDLTGRSPAELVGKGLS